MVDSDMCRYTQYCDQELIGGLLQEPSQQPDEGSCLSLCDSFNTQGDDLNRPVVVCRGYNFQSSTGSCEVLSSIADIDSAQGVSSRQVLFCSCNLEEPTSACGIQR